jgi:hypothetical protein
VRPVHDPPGLITAMLAFYDGVRRHGRTVIDFASVAVTALERDTTDRGAHADQTRFLVAAFRTPRRCSDRGVLDEHGLTAAAGGSASRFSHRHRAVGDRAGDASAPP